MPHIQRNGLSFHVQLLGSGPPLVMLHGLLVGSMASWYFGAAPRLAKTHRVLLYDMRGHGLSARAPAGYDLGTLAGDLGALAGEAGDGPVTVVGHSFGALTALRFALAEPERVRRLVVVEAPLPPSNLPELKSFLAAKPEDMLAALPPALAGQVSGGSRQGARWLEQLKFLATGSTLLADLAAEPDLDDAALARMTCPVTLVYGDRSGCRAAGERLARVIPGARLEILAGGHFLPTEAAGALTDVIVEAVHG